MSKLEELQNLINTLFEKAEDKSVIEQVGAVNSKINELKQESDQSTTQYKQLLDQYKDVVIHSGSATKPQNEVNGNPFDADKALMDALTKFTTK